MALLKTFSTTYIVATTMLTTALLLTFSSSASSASASSSSIGLSANGIVDDFLFNISHKLDEQFEPILLPDAGFEFEKKILMVTLKGEAKLTQGWLAGFSTLHRNGAASLSASPASSGYTRILKAPLGVSNLAGHYRGSVKFMSHGPTIEVDIKLGQLSVEMHLMQLDNDPVARLVKLDAAHVGKIEVKIKGLGVLDWVLTPLNSFLVTKLRKFIWNFLEKRVNTWLAEQIALESIQLPPVGWTL